MRYWEILAEAHPPFEEVIHYVEGPEGRRAVTLIGGRLFTDKHYDLKHAIRKINLKNVRSPHGPLLFHGTADPDIKRFSKHSWFTTEPMTASFHASFKKGLMHGPQATVYVCSAKITKPIINPDIQPGDEQPGDIDALYASVPGADAIVWRNATDQGIGPKADLYNIKDPSQIKILKVWRWRDEIVSHEEFESILRGEPQGGEKKHRRPDAIYKVTNPGLTPFNEGDYITDEEYDEWKDYLEVEPAK